MPVVINGSTGISGVDGSAGTPAFQGSDSNTGIRFGTDIVSLVTGGSDRLYIDSSGRLGIGTSSPKEVIDSRGALVISGDFATSTNAFGTAEGVLLSTGTGVGRITAISNGNNNVDLSLRALNAGTATEGIRIKNDGKVGIGTTNGTAGLGVLTYGTQLGAGANTYMFPSGRHHVQFGNVANGTDVYAGFTSDYATTSGSCNIVLQPTFNNTGQQAGAYIAGEATGLAATAITFGHFNGGATTGSNATKQERARIDSSGRLLVGTSSTSSSALLQVQGNSSSSTGDAIIQLRVGKNNVGILNGNSLGSIQFSNTESTVSAVIEAIADANWNTTNDYPSRLVFSTTADAASSPTERMRIGNGGHVLFNKTSVNAVGTPGVEIFGGSDIGSVYMTRNSGESLLINRLASDGALVLFYQDTVSEGSISVSGTTVSYNGAHLSRWSQLPSGVERTEILRGSVLSNIDEMCEWGDEENEQLNRMKVSDVEGDKNVAGVFQDWDDDDDTYINDFYCAMTGDFIIRVAAGVTVERGDLLMSAGDGTAKPQADDAVRSCTVAKVTSTHVTCTYDDGSYCVPCVLMAC